LIIFDGDNTITVSPVNIQYLPATIHCLSYDLPCVSQGDVAQFIK
jgi:hypothetical protein